MNVWILLDLSPALIGSLLTYRLVRLAQRENVQIRHAVAALVLTFTGVTLAGMMMMHVSLITYFRFISNDGFRYDFRYYALMHLAAVLIYGGVNLVRIATQVMRGCSPSRKAAARTALIVALTTAPLAPVQFYGGIFAALCLVTLFALWLASRTGSTSVDIVAPAAARDVRKAA